MSFEPQQNYQTSKTMSSDKTIDAGLQKYMQRVYNTMCLGLAVTGFVAFAVANTPALFNLIFGTPLHWVVAFAPLAILWFGLSPARVYRMSNSKVKTWFYGLSVLFGMSFSVYFSLFTAESLVRVFFITSSAFAATSLYGYTTKKDLTGFGSFLFMGFIGVFIASIVNIFLGSSILQFAISIIGVVVIAGLTAVDTQRIKQSYSLSYGSDVNDKMATMGALGLYINFIMMFQFLMNLMGGRE